eukprot:TRINITY_DN15460_c0_g1_i1.p1 TRINITY_DN15460_c0_g1~~TRINITY_DN15460_c0_g1_i1.p1  ORF type:complete len:402 (-),score=71.15 TRINITY_DN15460_c0_g1_i1:554-1759(-)
MSSALEKTALLERLRGRDLRSGTNPSKFSQAEGSKLIKDFLFKITASEISKDAFDTELSLTMQMIGNQMQKSWSTEPIRLQIIRRIQSKNFTWPDQDLRLFLFLIFEKILQRAYELGNQPTKKLPVQAMMKLHLNELFTIDYTDRVHIIEILRRWAGNEWEEAPNKSEKTPTNWSECVLHMKSIMRKAFEGNPNPVITLDFYAVLRGFMLSLMLLCIMDEQFFIHSLRSLLDILENETYAQEFIGALKGHVEAQQTQLLEKQKQLFTKPVIESLKDKYDLRLFWRAHGRKFATWMQPDTEEQEGKVAIQAALDSWLHDLPESVSEHKKTFLNDCVGIIKLASLQKQEGQQDKFDPAALVSLMQSANVQLSDAGLKSMNLRLMATSNEHLDNTSYTYIGAAQ